MGAVAGYGDSLQESCLEGFNSLGFHQEHAPVTQWIRVLCYERRSRRFESFRERQIIYTLFAKLVRHRILIPTCGGSSPSGGAICSYSIKALHYIGNVETLDRYQLGAPYTNTLDEWIQAVGIQW